MPNRYVYCAKFKSEYFRQKTGSKKVNQSPLFHVITYVILVEHTPTLVTN